MACSDVHCVCHLCVHLVPDDAIKVSVAQWQNHGIVGVEAQDSASGGWHPLRFQHCRTDPLRDACATCNDMLSRLAKHRHAVVLPLQVHGQLLAKQQHVLVSQNVMLIVRAPYSIV